MTDEQRLALDEKNAAMRQEVAARMEREYGDCLLLALAKLGPGYKPWMKLSLIDSDHRRTGDSTPAAVVYKVYKGEERVEANAKYLRKMPDGSVAASDTYVPLFAGMLDEKHPTMRIKVRSEPQAVGRYELCWGSLELYKPKSAEELGKTRASRKERRTAREEEKYRRDNPLLAYLEDKKDEPPDPEDR